MKLKSFLKRFFLGAEVLEKVNSPVNGEISVVENLFGGKELRIGGLTQSGGLVEKLWEKIFNFKFLILNQFQSSNFKCLILGLGCGTAAKLTGERWPEAKITGVEIDPAVVEIGRKYFGLGEIKNLEIVIGDAVKVISEKKYVIGKNFDLILVDLYLGKNYPKAAESKEFLRELKNILSEKGLVVINRLYYTPSYQKEAESFLLKVKEIFPNVKIKKAVTNLLVFASN